MRLLVLGVFASALAASAAEGGAPELSLPRLAREVAQSLAEAPVEPPVAVFIDAPSPELARAFSTVLAAELGSRRLPSFVLEAPRERLEHDARVRNARTLARVTLGFDSGLLSARGDAFALWENFWSGRTVTRTPRGAVAIAHSTVADAHALALAARGGLPALTHGGPLRLGGAVLTRLPTRTAALTTGDLDGDGRAEIVALTDDAVVVFTGGGRLVARYEHRALPPAQTPTREPTGTVVVLPEPRQLAYFSARHSHGERLELRGGQLHPVGKIDQPLWPWPRSSAAATLNPGQNSYARDVRAATGAIVAAPSPFVTLSAASVGGDVHVLLVSAEGSAVRFTTSAPAEVLTLEGVGAGSAIAELDGDGSPELITSLPATGGEDTLRILRAGGEVAWETKLASGRALQVAPGDVDGDGVTEVVVALWTDEGQTELQLFRRAP